MVSGRVIDIVIEVVSVGSNCYSICGGTRFEGGVFVLSYDSAFLKRFKRFGDSFVWPAVLGRWVSGVKFHELQDFEKSRMHRFQLCGECRLRWDCGWRFI